MKTDEDMLDRLRGVLAGGPALRLAVLFGSRATGRATKASDVDIGIVPFDPRLPMSDELALAAELSTAVGAEIDLVRLDVDDPLLGREVALTGVLLAESAPGAFAAFRADAMSRWVDFEETIAPHRERMLKRLAGGRA